MRATADIEQAFSDHGDAVWRACSLYFRDSSDAQDAYQETFLRYALADNTVFADDEHRKAWLIRVGMNVCKDMLKRADRANESLDVLAPSHDPVSCDPLTQPSSATRDVVDAMRSLPDPPRTPLYLALYEGYSAPEIARMANAPVNTVYSWISRGRKQLREALQ